MLITLSIIAWAALGEAGFIYWWTRDYDITTDEIVMLIIAPIMGPINWIIGWSIHEHSKIIIKRKD